MALKEDLMNELQKLRIGRETVKLKQQKPPKVKVNKDLDELKQLLEEIEDEKEN